MNYDAKQYEELKAKRQELEGLLERNKFMKHHATYKAVEKQRDEVRQKIKQLFHTK